MQRDGLSDLGGAQTGRIGAGLLLAATLAFAAAPLIAPPFTGYPSGVFPVDIPRPSIQPAGYAFSIWGVIYAWLVIHAGFGLLQRSDDPDWSAVRLPLGLACSLGAAWLFIAPGWPVTATVVIWAMLALSLVAFLRTPTVSDRWLLAAPLAIFAGWLSAAAAVSLGVVLGGYGILSDSGSALLMLALVLVIATGVTWQRPDMPVYPATIVWALVGVIIVNLGPNSLVATAATGGAIVVALVAIAARWRGA
jgi:hypothetical protein